MKLILILWLLLLTTICTAQINRKPWSKSNPITWEDFKGAVNDTSKFAVLSKYDEYYDYNWKFFNGRYTFSFKVVSKLHQDESWSKVRFQTPELLKHEQTHFDISEFFAMKELEALNHHRFTSNYVKEIASIALKYGKMRNVMEIAYDNDTKHCLNKDRQIIWDTYVSDLLTHNYSLVDALKLQPNLITISPETQSK